MAMSGIGGGNLWRPGTNRGRGRSGPVSECLQSKALTGSVRGATVACSSAARLAPARRCTGAEVSGSGAGAAISASEATRVMVAIRVHGMPG